MKKHLVFLLSDQHNPNIMSCAGDPFIRTPNFDRLAERGIMFDNCYCASPLCVPSRAALMSGLLPTHNGVYNNFQCLRSDAVTFAHCISAAGYETVLSGRMHFIGPDQRHGYEKRLVGDITPTLLGVPMDAFDDELKGADFPGRTPIEKAGFGYSNVLAFDTAVADGAIEFLHTRKDDRPLFLTVGFFGPHCPYVCPKELYDYYYAKLPEPEEVSDEYRRSVHPSVQRFYKIRQIEGVTKEQTRRVRAAYYGMVEYLDRLVGEVVGEIDRVLGLDNTIIVYASDHGDNLGYNGVFWKSNFFDGSARVPLVFSAPGSFRGGRRERGIASLMDLGPTLVEYADGPSLPRSDGRSLLRVLEEKEDMDERRAVISQLVDVKGDEPSIMVRRENWKLIIHAGYEHCQLFNLDQDPLERKDLGREPLFEGVRNDLARETALCWDVEQVLRQKEEDARHREIMKMWAEKVSITKIEQWQGAKKNNFVAH